MYTIFKKKYIYIVIWDCCVAWTASQRLARARRLDRAACDSEGYHVAFTALRAVNAMRRSPGVLTTS